MELYQYLDSNNMLTLSNPATQEQMDHPGYNNFEAAFERIKTWRNVHGEMGKWENAYGDELTTSGSHIILTTSRPWNAPKSVIKITPKLYDELVFQRGYASIFQIVGSHGPAMELYRYLESNNMLTKSCLLYTSPSPRDDISSRMPSSA